MQHIQPPGPWRRGRSRQVRHFQRPQAPADDNASVRFTSSARGRRTEFVLTSMGTAIFVERTDTGTPTALQVMTIFSDIASFNAWADDLPLRFDDPLTHMELKRHGRRLLAA